MGWTFMALVALAFAAFGVAVGTALGPVSRIRVERFARRQRLAVTPDNGDQVIAYLATTRRWRSAGLAAGVLASVSWALVQGVVRVDFLSMFAGWFVGALIAEVRVQRPALGPRRAASLLPRTPAAYVSPFAWYFLPATVIVSAVVGLLAAAVAVRDGSLRWPSVSWFAAALAVAAIVRAFQTRVLRRPQPIAARDVIAADDAIRSRSLHVLSGGGATLVLVCVAYQIMTLDLEPGDPLHAVVALLGPPVGLGIPLLGWHVATQQWRVRRPEAVP